ncbi:MAG: hypothetical protein ABSF59_13090 [Candidatus Sulfotelmatobacter sp.]
MIDSRARSIGKTLLLAPSQSGSGHTQKESDRKTLAGPEKTKSAHNTPAGLVRAGNRRFLQVYSVIEFWTKREFSNRTCAHEMQLRPLTHSRSEPDFYFQFYIIIQQPRQPILPASCVALKQLKFGSGLLQMGDRSRKAPRRAYPHFLRHPKSLSV